MKRLFSIIMLALCFYSCSAQKHNTFNKSVVKASKTTYDMKILNGNFKHIHNIKGKYYNVENHLPQNTRVPEGGDMIIDNDKLAQVCHDVFDDDRLAAIAKETEYLDITFMTDLVGNILDMSFGFKGNSSVTAIEIETLENKLKKELKAKINAKAFSGYTYVPISKFVYFKRLLNNEPKAIH